MSESLPYIRRFALSTSSWTPIIAPCPCDYFGILGNDDGSPMLRCSDPNNSETWYEMNGPYALVVHRGGPRRYETGDVVTYLKATTGSGPAIVEFIL